MEQELEDVTYRQTKAGELQWELHADRVVQGREGPAKLTGVTLRYFGGDVEPTRIMAREAEYDVETQNALLRGDVRVATPNGDTLESAKLLWQAEDEILETDAEVTLRRGGSYLVGSGLRTSPGLGNVHIEQVRGVLQEDELAG